MDVLITGTNISKVTFKIYTLYLYLILSDGEDKTEEEVPPPKPVQTSIRVRNPPGGKSSGIF